jgi:hypothetical protein
MEIVGTVRGAFPSKAHAYVGAPCDVPGAVTSNLTCIGLGVADPVEYDGLLTRLLARAELMGSGPGHDYHRWTDRSGARLTIRSRDGDPDYAVPSFAGRPGVRLTGLAALTGQVASADVLDVDGETATRLACELEQGAFLPVRPVTAHAAITAFGLDVRVYRDQAAYEASDDSLLDPAKKDQPRPDSLPDFIRWPLRKAAEAFVSYGLFGPAARAEPYAMFSGVVLGAATHTVALTGQSFHVARTASVGMEIDLCLAAAEHPEPPPAGAVVTGTVYLVASVDSLWP